MLVFGHAGFGQLLVRPWYKKLHLGWVAFGSLLPDLIDKPLFLIFPEIYGGSRLYGHTLIFLAAVAVAGLVSKSKKLISLASGIATHLLVDNLGDPLHVEHTTDASIRTLLWPLYGWKFPDALRLGGEAQIHRMLGPYFVTTELIGVILLIWFIRKSSLGARLKFLQTRKADQPVHDPDRSR